MRASSIEAKGIYMIVAPRKFPYVFVDGDFVPVEEARMSVHANALSYGTGTFEGVRAFWNTRGELHMLAAKEHFERMHRSAKILGLELRHSVDELVHASARLLQKNHVREDVYLRPLLVLASETLYVRVHGLRSRMSIAVTPMGLNYIDPKGVRCIVSSWRRSPDIVMPNRAKVTGGYVGPAMAKSEAILFGADEAIMLNLAGHVAEASTSNIFLRFANLWLTPPPQDDILEGITRSELFILIGEVLGEAVRERSLDRSELYAADEVLLCGTAALVVPVVAIDGHAIGSGAPGERTLELQRVLLAIGRRDISMHPEWATAVYEGTPAHARSFAEG
jgi:branched-chain amino acid aminotransferase